MDEKFLETVRRYRDKRAVRSTPLPDGVTTEVVKRERTVSSHDPRFKVTPAEFALHELHYEGDDTTLWDEFVRARHAVQVDVRAVLQADRNHQRVFPLGAFAAHLEPGQIGFFSRTN